MSARSFATGVLVATISLAGGAASRPLVQPASQTSPSVKGSQTKSTAAPDAAAVHPDEGQRIFDQNCSRCHNAPDGFSTRISRTVARHMRVRANLSRKDEQELLRFLNP